MYLVVKVLIVIICLSGIIYTVKMNNRYKNDNSSTKEDIIKYFKDKNANDVDSGISIKDLPIDISKNPFLLMMVKDKTLLFKKGKYYLNNDNKK